LEGVFGRPGCVIHGQVPAKTRTKLVERFQGEEYVPFMVLSLKAGGTGLNLTAANNVIHFDRWWNPAVENQATDRAFRIGQTKDVMVHKMVCEDTLEERIDEIIQGKSELVDQVVGEGETWIGNLNDDQLVQLLSFGSRR
jgi:non-specific serine/threonine protein kinase